MNREQMIAWLTLEGWVPKQHGLQTPEIENDGEALFVDQYVAKVQPLCPMKDTPDTKHGWNLIPTADLALLQCAIDNDDYS